MRNLPGDVAEQTFRQRESRIRSGDTALRTPCRMAGNELCGTRWLEVYVARTTLGGDNG
jgi:hypothetical protein